jgi:hypothetical protein
MDEAELAYDIINVLKRQLPFPVDFPCHTIQTLYAGPEYAVLMLHVIEFEYGGSYDIRYARYLVLAREAHGRWLCARDQFLLNWAVHDSVMHYPNLHEVAAKLKSDWHRSILQREIKYQQLHQLTSSSSASAAGNTPSQTPAALGS